MVVILPFYWYGKWDWSWWERTSGCVHYISIQNRRGQWVILSSVQFSSVAQSCPTLCGPMDCSMPGFPVLHCLPELAQTHVHWVIDAIQPSHLLLAPSPPASIFPSIRVFSKESVLCIKWPKYWSFSFSICASNEDSGLIPFRIDWFDLLADLVTE